METNISEKQMLEKIDIIHKQKNPVILAMIGQPGSGKTYFVSKLETLLKQEEYDVDKIKVHNNYIKPLYENPTLIRHVVNSTKDHQEAQKILQKIQLNKKDSIFQPNFNLPGAFDVDRFIDDLYNLSKGNNVTIKKYSPWDQVCTKDTSIIPSSKQVIIVEGPMAVIPKSEYEFCNTLNEQIEFSNKIVDNSSLYDLIISVKADVIDRILRRLRRCLSCPKKTNCHDNTPLSSLEFHEQNERNWLNFVEKEVKDKVFFLTNTLTKDEMENMNFYKNYAKDEISFFSKEKGISECIYLKFGNDFVEVTISIISPFDNVKKYQSFTLGNINKQKIIEAVEKYFKRF